MIDKKELVVTSIVVTYNPNVKRLSELIEKLKVECNYVVIVDNSDNDDLEKKFKNNNVRIVSNCNNLGIAYAQNIGFAKALELKSDFVATFDQDSNIQKDYISSMVKEYFLAKKYFDNIAVIGPSVINERDSSNLNIIKKNIEKKRYIISSGSIIPTDSLLYIGFNRSDWFIDLVDLEWCCRARKMGYSVLQSKKITLMHNLGEEDRIIPGLGYVQFSSPKRLYYFSRNSIRAIFCDSFSIKDKMIRLYLLLAEFYKSFYMCDRWIRIKYLLSGFFSKVG